MNEPLAVRISNALKDVCPAFNRSGRGPCEWHKCRCEATGGACTCVWHHSDRCTAGTWEHLTFARTYNEERIAKRDKVLTEVRQVMNKTKNEPVESRSQILDL